MIIIDASVAAKFINTQESGSEKALELLASHLKQKEKISVPSLLFLEVANALATKTKVQPSQIEIGLSLLYEAEFYIYEIKQKDVMEASLLAKKYSTSVYDMIYAVVAKLQNATLVTADSRFIQKVNFSFVRELS